MRIQIVKMTKKKQINVQAAQKKVGNVLGMSNSLMMLQKFVEL